MAELLTTTQAARRAKTSRPTISRALKTGDLPGIRGNDGKWLILTNDLDAWADMRSSVHDERVLNTVQERQESKDFERLNGEIQALREDLAAAREAVARAEGEGAANRARIEDLAAERDRLLTMLESRPTDLMRPIQNRGGRWRFLDRVLRRHGVAND